MTPYERERELGCAILVMLVLLSLVCMVAIAWSLGSEWPPDVEPR